MSLLQSKLVIKLDQSCELDFGLLCMTGAGDTEELMLIVEV